MTQDPSTHGVPPADATAEPSERATDAPDATDERPRPVPTPPTIPSTGLSTSAGVGDLEGLDELPVAEHVERFTRVHDALRARLDGGPDAGPQR
ncbi:hypothetical protein [Isoptericola sp. NPDC019482]|uniref:hypothetical protein n=1 Tax=Isoptericola sp. NPDC019482 TaxID=3154688 RepID=UPI0034810CE2